MNIIGISGGFDSILEGTAGAFDLTESTRNDSAAVLLRDGEVLFAVEEERLNRIPRTNYRPVLAIERCLQAANLSLSEIDKIVVYGEEKFYNFFLQRNYLANPNRYAIYATIREWIRNYLKEAFNFSFDLKSIIFVKHQYAHAMSAYACSGFESALVLSLDKSEDGFSGLVAKGSGLDLESLQSFHDVDSLITFCRNIGECLEPPISDTIQLYRIAAAGNAAVYRPFVASSYELLPGGGYKLKLDSNALHEIWRLEGIDAGPKQLARRASDLAASLQEMIEAIVFHIVTHYQQVTGMKRLCFAGELAANTVLNGKLLQSGLFEEVFVQPVHSDAGAALGAALSVFQRETKKCSSGPWTHLYWGSPIEPESDVLEAIELWDGIISRETEDYNLSDLHSASEKAASLLAAGEKVGWVQGRSEFGPNSLGNRCLLSDPRIAPDSSSAGNEAGSVCISIKESAVDQYFDIPLEIQPSQFRFGNYSLEWKDELQPSHKAGIVGASAVQVHAVAESDNPALWELLDKFEQETGLPFVAQFSLRSPFEPLPETAHDAIASMITGDFNYMAVGGLLVCKQRIHPDDLLRLKPMLPKYAYVHRKWTYKLPNEKAQVMELSCTCRRGFSVPLSAEVYRVLMNADGERTIMELLSESDISAAEDVTHCCNHLMELWAKRLLLLPAG
ncbi:carbamoyltransferase N-terminal domain-containing protein [Paenibacillus sp. GCM10012307]|uniref:Carbamoyltransferase n=1 Tax=Paenibacillus roseus TaxID=2798579 RepID=A0A934J359_9BACL|nr:carbamoyltransferase N-terminal domain-containing protein [Paenibacillus roseus]MBJ6359991.1 hypothetical protein [Paenibacillus roseus]